MTLCAHWWPVMVRGAFCEMKNGCKPTRFPGFAPRKAAANRVGLR